ncbi:helix-turn-helix domain-containing protein [Nocardia sp. NPDC056064]|uniref:helix-turn-helix domain-containing protein n=1 Tax=Nocardia sp. NPDC056064 TaxID=3345701 RepID=UPI0035E20B1B
MRPIMSDDALDARWELARPVSTVPGLAMKGFLDRAAAGSDLRIFARPAVVVVIQFGDSRLVVDEDTADSATGGLVAGWCPGARRVHARQVACVEVLLSPIAAYGLLGGLPRELDGSVPGPQELWGRAAARLTGRLAETDSWTDRFALTARFLAERRAPATLDPEVAASWARLVATDGAVRVRDLAQDTGWSRKRLWSRFTAQVGVTPKRAATVIRFRAALEQLQTGAAPAEVAARCGYADQSHLSREVAAFTGTTPGALVRHRPEQSSKTVRPPSPTVEP